MRSKVPVKPFGRPVPARTRTPKKLLSIHPGLFYGGFAALIATNVLTFVGLLMAPDLSRMFTGQNDAVLSAYEDRISELRVEVDRLQSRHYAQAGDINLQLQELQQAQEVLMEQHQYVKQLADTAAALGLEPKVTADAGDQAGGSDTLLTGSISPASLDPPSEVAATAAGISRMMDESRMALAALSDEATSKTDGIMATLAGVGIKPKLPTFDDDAEGGPLLPPVDGVEVSSALVDDANAVAEALERYKVARGAADSAPVHKPLTTATRVSSTFGNRKDPFTGRLAFHSGIDFAAPQGTTVLSAGYGKVIYVGQISGYGNVVEIDHGNGLVTLYGHLSAFLVKEGQVVKTGTPIARVGSTGRSTGPHLHFEVRRSDDAVDPSGYLTAGRNLQKILAT